MCFNLTSDLNGLLVFPSHQVNVVPSLQDGPQGDQFLWFRGAVCVTDPREQSGPSASIHNLIGCHSRYIYIYNCSDSKVELKNVKHMDLKLNEIKHILHTDVTHMYDR